MKLVVVGLGQCGGRIADEFALINAKARSRRGMTIVTGAFAVNSDAADLAGLTNISKDSRRRILIGGRQTGGHGVGKIILKARITPLGYVVVQGLIPVHEPRHDFLYLLRISIEVPGKSP